MAVTGVQKIMLNEELREQYAAGPPILYRETYQVFTDDPEEQRATILSNVGLPQPRSSHPENSAAILYDRLLTRDPNTRTVWYCECQWATSANNSDDPTDPLSKYEVRWRTVQRTKIAVRGYLRDIDTGQYSTILRPITNSANDLPADPYEIPESFLEATILIRSLSVPTYLVDYRDAVNSDYVTIDGITFAPGQCLIQGFEVGPWQTQQEITFREVTLVVWITSDWLLRFLDVGWHEIDAGADEKLRALDAMGQPVGAMVPLDGHGAQLNPRTGTPVFRTYRVFEELPYAPLGLI